MILWPASMLSSKRAKSNSAICAHLTADGKPPFEAAFLFRERDQPMAVMRPTKTLSIVSRKRLLLSCTLDDAIASIGLGFVKSFVSALDQLLGVIVFRSGFR